MKFTSIFVASAFFAVIVSAIPDQSDLTTGFSRSIFKRREVGVRMAEPQCQTCVCGRPGAPICAKRDAIPEAAPEPEPEPAPAPEPAPVQKARSAFKRREIAVRMAEPEPQCQTCVCGRPGAPICAKRDAMPEAEAEAEAEPAPEPEAEPAAEA